MLRYEYDDGGRAGAGYKGKTGDCGIRAVSIFSGAPYKDVYLAARNLCKCEKVRKRKKASSPRGGLQRDTMDALVRQFVPTAERVSFGVGEKPTLSECANRYGRFIGSVTKHFVAVADYTVRDIWDCRMSIAYDASGVAYSDRERRVFQVWRVPTGGAK